MIRPLTGSTRVQAAQGQRVNALGVVTLTLRLADTVDVDFLVFEALVVSAILGTPGLTVIFGVLTSRRNRSLFKLTRRKSPFVVSCPLRLAEFIIPCVPRLLSHCLPFRRRGSLAALRLPAFPELGRRGDAIDSSKPRME
jgi:hypothetical protein